MLTMHVPTLLALLGTVLMAVVIFAPSAAVASRPLAPKRFSALPFEAVAGGAFAPLARLPEPAPSSPAWPALVDPSAACCDAPARLALVDALATVRTPWAAAILKQALDEESDESVRAAITAAQWS